MPGPSLTPSERVYLHAEAFARERTLKQAIGLVHSDKKVDASELNSAILAAAVLGAERAGRLRLRVGERSKWFGLRKAPGLFLEATGDAALFPAGTLEHDLAALAQGAKDGEATELLKTLLREDSSWPETNSLGLVQEGLAKRGLLTSEQTKRFGFIRVDLYRTTEALLELRAGQGPEDIAKLFDEARTSRPTEWGLLQDAIRAATQARKEYDSDGPD